MTRLQVYFLNPVTESAIRKQQHLTKYTELNRNHLPVRITKLTNMGLLKQMVSYISRLFRMYCVGH